MKKSELEKLQGKYFIMDDNINDFIYFISELLETRADEVEADEPYASNTIKRYREAAYQVYELKDYIETIQEEGVCRG